MLYYRFDILFDVIVYIIITEIVIRHFIVVAHHLLYRNLIQDTS